MFSFEIATYAGLIYSIKKKKKTQQNQANWKMGEMALPGLQAKKAKLVTLDKWISSLLS